MMTLLHIAGGVALVLYGIRVLRKGLDRLFGARLADWLQRLSTNRWRAAATGVFISLLSPSSTSITLLGVQLVKGRLLTFQRVLAVMLGASIGLTIELQLISLQLYQQAPIAILIGVVGFQFFRDNTVRGIGQTLLGLGFIFLAVGLIKDAAAGVAGNQDIADLIRIFARYPWALFLLGALLTVALQSSTAALSLILALGASGMLGMEVALPYVIGADVGLGLTTFLVAYGDREARRLGYAYLGMRLLLAALLMLLLPIYGDLIAATGESAARRVANAHSIFNVLLALVWVAPLPLVVSAVRRFVPDSEGSADPHRAIYLNESYLDSPPIVFGQSQREIMRVADYVERMLRDAWAALRDRDLELCDRIHATDDVVDALDKQIKRFLAQAGREAYDERQSRTQVRHLRFINILETIGDLVDKNLVELARKRIEKRRYFSDAGFEELQQAHQMVLENFHILCSAFATGDEALARRLIRHESHLAELDADLRRKHFDRLTAGVHETLESSSIHLDVLSYLKAINTTITSAAWLILEEGEAGGKRQQP
jgi:phosphate:Na+ symporter